MSIVPGDADLILERKWSTVHLTLDHRQRQSDLIMELAYTLLRPIRGSLGRFSRL